VSIEVVTGLKKGQRINFVYEFPGEGGFTRRGTVDRVVNKGIQNVIKEKDGQEFVAYYAENPPRPKGQVLLTIYDETQGGYRSFYADYIRNLSLIT
jgi:hypothetical protein